MTEILEGRAAGVTAQGVMQEVAQDALDLATFGHRLRHLRRARGLTLEQLAGRVGRAPSQLSLLENGRREPKLSLLSSLAAALGVPVADLLASTAPSRRAQLEIALERAQLDPIYAELGLPHLKPRARVPSDVLEHLVGLYEELRRRDVRQTATPEEARAANAALRAEMRDRQNYFSDIESLAARALAAVGHRGEGGLTQRVLLDLAAHFGFTLHYEQDLPRSVRSVSDLRHGRIYLPQRDALGTHDARTVVLQTLGHFALEHADPRDFADFLRQRVAANYFAGALLLPERVAVPFLRQAKHDRALAVEDLENVFSVSYEMAAHRFTNLATQHLELPVHFVRSDESGTVYKAYENDGVRFPADATGAIEGQRLCRHWAARQVFTSPDKFSAHRQYTDTRTGTFWCSTHVEIAREPAFAVTIGLPYADARWFRGRDTTRRAKSACPDSPCCQRPPADLADRWDGRAWPSARAHSHVLAALPPDTFPGVDTTDVYTFLERHAPTP